MKGLEKMKTGRFGILCVLTAALLAPSGAFAAKYYNAKGREIHWMEPNFPFGIVRGALTIAQGPLEYFPAVAAYMRAEQNKPNAKQEDAFANLIVGLGLVGPCGAVLGSIPHAFVGAADIITLGLNSENVYSSGIVTPLIWEQEEFWEKCKITKGYRPASEIPTKPAYKPQTTTPSYTPSETPAYTPPTSVSAPAQEKVPAPSIPTSAPMTDDD